MLILSSSSSIILVNRRPFLFLHHLLPLFPIVISHLSSFSFSSSSIIFTVLRARAPPALTHSAPWPVGDGRQHGAAQRDRRCSQAQASRRGGRCKREGARWKWNSRRDREAAIPTRKCGSATTRPKPTSPARAGTTAARAAAAAAAAAARVHVEAGGGGLRGVCVPDAAGARESPPEARAERVRCPPQRPQALPPRHTPRRPGQCHALLSAGCRAVVLCRARLCAARSALAELCCLLLPEARAVVLEQALVSGSAVADSDCAPQTLAFLNSHPDIPHLTPCHSSTHTLAFLNSHPGIPHLTPTSHTLTFLISPRDTARATDAGPVRGHGG
eukprot:925925-Rhodomonas_salina.1